MIGKALSPVLEEIERKLWQFEANGGDKPNYDLAGFRASMKIFMSTLLDKMCELQEKEGMSIEDRGNMAEKVGLELRKSVKTYTDIDTIELFK